MVLFKSDVKPSQILEESRIPANVFKMEEKAELEDSK